MRLPRVILKSIVACCVTCSFSAGPATSACGQSFDYPADSPNIFSRWQPAKAQPIGLPVKSASQQPPTQPPSQAKAGLFNSLTTRFRKQADGSSPSRTFATDGNASPSKLASTPTGDKVARIQTHDNQQAYEIKNRGPSPSDRNVSHPSSLVNDQFEEARQTAMWERARPIEGIDQSVLEKTPPENSPTASVRQAPVRVAKAPPENRKDRGTASMISSSENSPAVATIQPSPGHQPKTVEQRNTSGTPAIGDEFKAEFDRAYSFLDGANPIAREYRASDTTDSNQPESSVSEDARVADLRSDAVRPYSYLSESSTTPDRQSNDHGEGEPETDSPEQRPPAGLSPNDVISPPDFVPWSGDTNLTNRSENGFSPPASMELGGIDAMNQDSQHGTSSPNTVQPSDGQASSTFNQMPDVSPRRNQDAARARNRFVNDLNPSTAKRSSSLLQQNTVEPSLEPVETSDDFFEGSDSEFDTLADFDNLAEMENDDSDVAPGPVMQREGNEQPARVDELNLAPASDRELPETTPAPISLQDNSGADLMEPGLIDPKSRDMSEFSQSLEGQIETGVLPAWQPPSTSFETNTLDVTGNKTTSSPVSKDLTDHFDTPSVLKNESAIWWKQRVMLPLHPQNRTLPVNPTELVLETLRNSPRIKAISKTPLIREMQVVEEQAEFDPLLFLQSQFQDRVDPVGNSLTTGGDLFLKDNIWSAEGGVRQRLNNGANVELNQRLGFQNSNSNFFTPQDQGTATLALNFTQPLMRGSGTYINRSQILIAQTTGGAAWDLFKTELQEELEGIVAAYWDLYFRRSVYLQKKRNVERGEAMLARLEGRSELDSLPAQIARARSAVLTRKTELANAFRDIRNAETEIRRRIADRNWQASQTIELLPLEVPFVQPMGIELEQVVHTAIRHRPEIAESLKRIRVAGIQRDVSINELLPDLSLLLGTYVSGLRGDTGILNAFQDQFGQVKPGYSVGLEFEMPYRNRAARSRLSQRSLQFQRMQNELEIAIQNVIAEAQVANRRVHSANETLIAAQTAVEASRADLLQNEMRWESFALVEGDFSEGQTPTTLLDQLLDSQDRLAQAENIYSQAEQELKVSQVALQRSMGTLLMHQQVDFSRQQNGDMPSIHVTKPRVQAHVYPSQARISTTQLSTTQGSTTPRTETAVAPATWSQPTLLTPPTQPLAMEDAVAEAPQRVNFSQIRAVNHQEEVSGLSDGQIDFGYPR